jgi:hypothetical protein
VSWNYRVVRTTMPSGEVRYGIHEVHYGVDSEDREGKTPQELEKDGLYWTEDPVGVDDIKERAEDDVTDAIASLRTTLRFMGRALDLPIVDGDSPNGLPLIENTSPRARRKKEKT